MFPIYALNTHILYFCSKTEESDLHPFIEPPWGQLGIRQIQKQVFLFGQAGHKSADERGLPAARIRSDYRKELAVCRIGESPQGIRHGR